MGTIIHDTAKVQGYFDVPVDNITAEPAFWRWIKDNHLMDAILVTPNPQVSAVFVEYINSWITF